MMTPDQADLAACRGKPVEMFVPVRGDWRLGREAIAICGTCPVRLPCLEEALGRPWTTGIWGGYTDNQRAALRSLGRHPARKPRPVS